MALFVTDLTNNILVRIRPRRPLRGRVTSWAIGPGIRRISLSVGLRKIATGTEVVLIGSVTIGFRTRADCKELSDFEKRKYHLKTEKDSILLRDCRGVP